MPIKNYGVWKAEPLSYTYETAKKDHYTPHLYLKFRDSKIQQAEAAINIKSGDQSDSRLVYWVDPAFDHPLIDELKSLEDGFHSLQSDSESGNLRLDYIRENLFQKQTGRLLPHDIPGEDNDILDVLKPIMNEAISSKATVYLYGSRFDDNGNGIHNVHMNQGSARRWQEDNGVYHDGGLFLQFDKHWKAIFLAFASQAIHTNDSTGNPDPQHDYITWAHFLDPEVSPEDRERNELTDTPVLISQASVNPPSIKLTNRTAQPLDLSGWKIRNRAGQVEKLSSGTSLAAREVSKEFSIPNCPLSDQGEVITLLNAQNFKVHGVSYSRAQRKREGNVISFKNVNGLN